MPRPRMPPTPSSSTDILARDKTQVTDMESVFAFPPPAVQSANSKHGTSKSYNRTANADHTSPPISPKDGRTGTALQRKRTISGGSKSRPESTSTMNSQQQAESALPPPPSRARKIIQMKPKQVADKALEHSASTSSTKEAPTLSTTAAKRKQSQPSATSAAGRKIARKTAHSIIERRRRSKMNEEFGVLKDMIPACAGVEMHKLAILQAGIEYVKYLEGCIEKLKGQNGQSSSERDAFHATPVEDDDDDEEEDDSMDISPEDQDTSIQLQSSNSVVSDSDITSPSAPSRPPLPQMQQRLPPIRRSSISTSTTNSGYPSPDIRPVQSLSSTSTTAVPHSHSLQMSRTYPTQHVPMYSTSPSPLTGQTQLQNPTGVSPAFGAFHFSPELTRTSTWSSINAHSSVGKPSPNILPLPQAAMPFSSASMTSAGGVPGQGPQDANDGDSQAEVTATAALLMMTKDRRGSTTLPKLTTTKGMSVRDLLSS